MRSKGKLSASIIAALFVLTLLFSASFAVPKTINYQGRLAGSEGTPVNGTVSITFAIYNAPTGGELLWSETQPSVTVTDGAFSVALGSITPFTITFDEDYYLGVKVEADNEMDPRAVLVSVPYAIRAKEADTAGYAATAGAANTAVTLGDKTLSELVSLLDSRYGNLGDSLVVNFTSDMSAAAVNETVNFTAQTQGVPISWLWDFGDTGTNTLQNPSHTYTADGTYTVSLTVGDGVTSNTVTKTDYIKVYSFRGTITTVDSVGTVGDYTSIAVGTDGLPIVSYLNYNGTTLQYELKAAHCGDASCSTGNTLNTVDSVGAPQYTSIAIGADNLPVISYQGGMNLKVTHCGDAACTPATNTITTVDSVGNVGKYTSIAIGTDGLPVISYYNATSEDLVVAHCGNATCSTGNTITTVDSAGNVGLYTSIAIGTDGLPLISYLNYNGTTSQYDLKVAHCGDASCSTGNTITTVDSAGTGTTGQRTSIAIGADGLPVVSYLDATNEYLKVTHCGNAACSSGNTITIVDLGWFPSIAIGADGLPVISYYDSVVSNLAVKHCGNASCTLGNIRFAVESLGTFNSIAIGTDGLPVISYFRSTGYYDLKVAKCGDATCALWP